jgi:hypothetical protein
MESSSLKTLLPVERLTPSSASLSESYSSSLPGSCQTYSFYIARSAYLRLRFLFAGTYLDLTLLSLRRFSISFAVPNYSL